MTTAIMKSETKKCSFNLDLDNFSLSKALICGGRAHCREPPDLKTMQ